MQFILTVNPHGGTKQGPLLLKKVKPIFDAAGADLLIIETTFAGHANELAHKLDFDGYDGMIVIGGDGTMHEVVNGMLTRSDKKQIPIGLIPGGTGNSFMHDLELMDPVDDPSGGSPVTKKITKANLVTDIAQSDITDLTTDLALKAPLTSPTLVTPNIGTPSAGTLTSCTGLPATTGLTATGTKDATTFLRGDDTWAVVDASPLTTKGDVYTYDTGNARLAVGTDGEVLKADSSTATGLAWGSGGGGATAVHTFTNTTTTTYTGTASSFGSVGVGDRDIYIKKIDANNEGVFTKIWKNGAAVEVQIA